MIQNCKMRHENGNCLPAGGFCTANKNICEALQNAYEMGQRNAIALPSADKDGLYKILNEAHNEGYDVGYWAGRRDYEQKWTPCSEGLPEEKDAGILKKLGINKMSDDVIATVDVKGTRMTVTACTYEGKWDWNMKNAFPDFKVVAWMPLPKPYEEERKEE